jgi:nicotinate-nucleotide pyrophosphorylase (carboxylating)
MIEDLQLYQDQLIDQIIQLAILEDIGDGDHTSRATIPATHHGRMKLLVKQPGILAGIKVAERIFAAVDPQLKMKIKIEDGTAVQIGDIAFTVSGPTQSLLQAERLVLNFMQRLSGVATQTSKYVELVHGLKTKVLDTRKTTPGMRVLEKQAVVLGGGANHRMGLFDMILIKDNHVDFAGGVIQAIEQSVAYLKETGRSLPIEVEVRTMADINNIIAWENKHHSGTEAPRPIQRIMLDNFSIKDTKKAVELINGRYEIESSGGITYDTLRAYAECGVDVISVGALTHQIKSLDLSLKAY